MTLDVARDTGETDTRGQLDYGYSSVWVWRQLQAAGQHEIRPEVVSADRPADQVPRAGLLSLQLTCVYLLYPQTTQVPV